MAHNLNSKLAQEALEATGGISGFIRDADGRPRAHVMMAAHNQDGEQTMAGGACVA